MVLVEEVKEDIIIGERESDFETDSELSDDESVFSDDDFDPASETLGDRIAALKDIVPPETRTSLKNTAAVVKDWSSWAANSTGNVLWWISTSALLVGLPLMLAIEDEAKITQQEREIQMQSQGQQQVSGEMNWVGRRFVMVASEWMCSGGVGILLCPRCCSMECSYTLAICATVLQPLQWNALLALAGSFTFAPPSLPPSLTPPNLPNTTNPSSWALDNPANQARLQALFPLASKLAQHQHQAPGTQTPGLCSRPWRCMAFSPLRLGCAWFCGRGGVLAHTNTHAGGIS